jgi:hypothetical protein
MLAVFDWMSDSVGLAVVDGLRLKVKNNAQR